MLERRWERSSRCASRAEMRSTERASAGEGGRFLLVEERVERRGLGVGWGGRVVGVEVAVLRMLMWMGVFPATAFRVVAFAETGLSYFGRFLFRIGEGAWN